MNIMSGEDANGLSLVSAIGRNEETCEYAYVEQEHYSSAHPKGSPHCIDNADQHITGFEPHEACDKLTQSSPEEDKGKEDSRRVSISEPIGYPGRCDESRSGEACETECSWWRDGL